MADNIVSQSPSEHNDLNLNDSTSLWEVWWNAFLLLRPAFVQMRSFLWFTVIVVGLTINTESLGVTSIVRALKLQPRCYESLIKYFHSNAVRLDMLTRLWALGVVPRLFPNPVRCHGRRVFVGDGIKVGKCGRKMPAVKLLHQESENKAEYVMGHSLQAVGMLVYAGSGVLAVPLSIRIHEGLVWCNARKKTLYVKMLELLESVTDESFSFVADAYYAVRPMLAGLLNQGNHLITRVKTNAVAHVPYVHTGTRKKGRPRKYGERVPLASLLKKRENVQIANSPLMGEHNVTIEYIVSDLLWKPIGCLVRFVIVIHPSKGTWFLLSTDTSLAAIEIISLYGLRFRIEVSFKQAVHSIGTFTYRFWLKAMKRLHFGDGDQYLHRTSPEYRASILRKIHAYHTFIQAGVIAQGLLMYLGATFPKLVWKSFGSWLRTIRPDVVPSEFVVAQALRESMPHFLASNEERHALTKFILGASGVVVGGQQV